MLGWHVRNILHHTHSKMPLPIRDLDLYLVHSSLDSPESAPQMASWLVQPQDLKVLQDSFSISKGRQSKTDRPCSNRPHLAGAEMWRNKTRDVPPWWWFVCLCYCVALLLCVMWRYVFKRLRFLGNKELSQCVTMFFLALWHGLYSGYFMNFTFEFFIMLFERKVSLSCFFYSFDVSSVIKPL